MSKQLSTSPSTTSKEWLLAELKRRGELEAFLLLADKHARKLRKAFGDMSLFEAWRLVYQSTPVEKLAEEHANWERTHPDSDTYDAEYRLRRAKEKFIKERALDIMQAEYGR